MTKLTSHRKTALWVLLTPLALLGVCAGGLIVTNSILTTTLFYNSDGFVNGSLHPVATLIPFVLLTVGVVGAVTLIPCLIIGVRMLRKKDSHAKN